MTQKCYLLTSPEKYQASLGNGSSNMDSRGNIGRRSSDGQRKTSALCLPLESPPPLVWDDTSDPSRLKVNANLENGLSMATVTVKPMFSDGKRKDDEPSSLKTLFPPTKLDK